MFRSVETTARNSETTDPNNSTPAHVRSSVFQHILVVQGQDRQYLIIRHLKGLLLNLVSIRIVTIKPRIGPNFPGRRLLTASSVQNVECVALAIEFLSRKPAPGNDRRSYKPPPAM